MTATTPLVTLFLKQAAARGDRVALTYFDHKAAAWKSLSWRQYAAAVLKIAGWLRESGIGHGDKIAILSANRPEWLIADLGIMAAGAVSVPIYATAAARDVAYILEHSESKALFIDKLSRLPPAGCPVAASRTVVFERGDFESLLASAAPALTAGAPVTSGDLATIVYTSGTTGVPKGVMHSHGNLSATVEPVIRAINSGGTAPEDRFFSFLPLSHVAERVLVEIGSIAMGAEVAFARGVETLVDDLAIHRPTILLCVPRLWERIHERIQSGLVTASPLKRRAFALALKAGGARIVGASILRSRDRSLRARLADRLVGRALKHKLGMDRIRLFLTGSAPTSPEILKFFGSLGIFIREVYGLTENLCLGVYTEPGEIAIGACGRPFFGNEMRLAEDGEIQFRAPWTFLGYYKNEAATREVLTDDGWLGTGDLGNIDAQGRLRITGRKKELLKTSTGKYVAPVPIEDQLKRHPLIADAMMVGDNRKYCVALIVLDAERAKADGGLEAELAAHLSSLNASLAAHEAVRRLGILREPFSVDGGTLTPTLKLKRNVATSHYAEFIARVYDSSTTIVRQ